MPVTPPVPRPLNNSTRIDISRSQDVGLEETDYVLSDSALLPAIRFVDDQPTAAKSPTAAPLDPETQALFQQRLRICCLVASLPFTVFFVSSLTGYIELFSRPVVGWTGVFLSGAIIVLFTVVAGILWRVSHIPLVGLRVLEITIFGAMGIFFAYWSFALLTAENLGAPMGLDDQAIERQEEYTLMAAALIVHFNWFALIVFHGVLVPNTLARGAGVVIAILFAALIMDGISLMVHDATYRHKWVLVAVALTILPTAAGLAIFGTAKTAELREEIQVTKQAMRELGQYRLRRKLGHGGMGEVYLAEHALLKRPCAVKRIHPKYLNSLEQIKRFEREVQTTARLRHPNTVEIFDYGRADDGTFFYVMEYLPGLSLEEIVNRHGPLPPERAVHLIRQVCGALREAHQMGLIHRDIKPSNIVVLPNDSPHDQVKLVDFGLVQSLTSESDHESKITRDGLIVGTPEYMSPEQAQGMVLDERSDLFSLGSVMYFLLTGREAFHRENAVKTLLAVVNEEPIPIQKINPFIPDDLAAVVGICLSKSFNERYAKALDLDTALSHCDCSQVWTAENAIDWWIKHPIDATTGTDIDSLPFSDSSA